MTVTIDIEKSVYGGDGLGRLGDGRVCFVAGAFPGEKVKADIFEQKRNFVRARLVEVLEASPDRLADPGTVVPGMAYAAVSYAAELRCKQDQLENFLWKAAHSVVPLEVVGADTPLHYRNKAVYHVERRSGRWMIGYRAEPSHEVEDIVNDPLVRPEINSELASIRSGVLALLTQGARSVRASAKAADNVTVRWTGVDGVKWWLGNPPTGLELHETVDGSRYRVFADGFFQINPGMSDRLVKAVKNAYLAGAEEAPNLLDLYCGVGVFGLACLTAARARGIEARLVGVESVHGAIACAKRNAEAAGLAANFFCERVGASVGRIKIGSRHTVIVDPPRGGMEPNVPGWLAKRGAKRLFYVSCDPATLTRDLASLLRGYAISKVMLFDLFPRTARFETLVEMERLESKN